MGKNKNFFNIKNLKEGIPRKLTSGLSTRIFVGENAMLSVVIIKPNAKGTVHSHSEEQWGYLLEGSGIRIQDGIEHHVKAGDFWMTPGGISHGFVAGESGAKILDFFSPLRKEYLNEGKGYK